METYQVLFKEGETTGVYGISLVNDPAMESHWITLSKEQLKLKSVDITIPEVFVGGLIGAMTVFIFAAWAI